MKLGLAALQNTARPGLRALMATTGARPGATDVESIAYGLAPRLNAAGRLAHAEASLRLLLTTSDSEGQALAAQLNSLNQERQRQTEQAVALATELLAIEDPEGSLPLIFIAHPDIPQGIAGLVASRLLDERYRPAVVCQTGEEQSRASCRSIPEFDIVGALRRQEKLLVRFGGHRLAAGFTVANENLPALKQALLEHADETLVGGGAIARSGHRRGAAAGPPAGRGDPLAPVLRTARSGQPRAHLSQPRRAGGRGARRWGTTAATCA